MKKFASHRLHQIKQLQYIKDIVVGLQRKYASELVDFDKYAEVQDTNSPIQPPITTTTPTPTSTTINTNYGDLQSNYDKEFKALQNQYSTISKTRNGRSYIKKTTFTGADNANYKNELNQLQSKWQTRKKDYDDLQKRHTVAPIRTSGGGHSKAGQKAWVNKNSDAYKNELNAMQQSWNNSATDQETPTSQIANTTIQNLNNAATNVNQPETPTQPDFSQYDYSVLNNTKQVNNNLDYNLTPLEVMQQSNNF